MKLLQVAKQITKKVLAKVGLYHQPKAIQPKQAPLNYGSRTILEGQVGNDLIKHTLANGNPCMITRLGSTELALIVNYLHIRNKKEVTWQKSVIQNIAIYSGFFPANPTTCSQLAELYLHCLPTIDILGVWYNEGEDWVTESYCPQAYLAKLRAIEPYYHQNPWSELLADKIVLVIHPFADTIQKQISENRVKLFEDKHILPNFTLKTIKAVQSIADEKHNIPFKTWFEALDYMQNEVSKTNFDIAIIGAGAYGLPLASFVKSLGKQVVHMGGATQILFGIFGNRWESNEIIKGFQNQYWVRPAPHEIPKGANKVENACYW